MTIESTLGQTMLPEESVSMWWLSTRCASSCARSVASSAVCCSVGAGCGGGRGASPNTCAQNDGSGAGAGGAAPANRLRCVTAQAPDDQKAIGVAMSVPLDSIFAKDGVYARLRQAFRQQAAVLHMCF